MEVGSKNNDVLQLLRKLKDANGSYPQELFVARRQGYLRQVAEVAGVAGLAMGLRNTVQNARGASGLPPAAGTLLEGLLVVAIIAEASTLAYFYRSQLAAYIQKLTNQPRVEEVTNPPVFSSPIPGLQLPPSPLVIETVTGIEATRTPDLTVTVQLGDQPTEPSTDQGSGSRGGQPASTAVPDGGSEGNGNNGNHYGQTPKPERTKENDPGNSNNNDSSKQDTQTNSNRKNK